MQATGLLELMTDQVARQREELLAKARRDAEAIRQTAEQDSAARRQAAQAAAEREVNAAALRSRERAESAANMTVHTTKDSIADEILASVARELEQIAAGPGFEPILEALLDELLPEAQPGLTVLAPPAHVERVRQWLRDRGQGELRVEALPGLTDGVALQNAERTYRVTNTLSARFDILQSQARKLSLDRLKVGEQ